MSFFFHKKKNILIKQGTENGVQKTSLNRLKNSYYDYSLP